MAAWAGFTERELRHMQGLPESPRPVDQPRKPPTAALNRQQIQRRKALQSQTAQLAKQDGALSAPSDMQLSRPAAVPSPAPPDPGDQPKSPSTGHCASLGATETKTEPDEQIAEKDVELREKPRLGQLQLEQRLMEEKNKRKKALLSKAIAERSKKTQAETLKLRRIQNQLQALDDLVSTDIGILRNRIDQACFEFAQAKKRFDKAESEYILAKLDLHKKTELKEQLTEHLCTIIQENEVRKSKRLEELMKQLEVETDEEKLELEIEVEQMLQRQEAEARKQLIVPEAEQSTKPGPVEENIPPAVEKEPSAVLLNPSNDGGHSATPETNPAPDG
ncbi:RAB6-interacting golgin [Pelobates fuscus]|uniref:RAB6-interacting golgin n=1 Tax=Pelobates fuscus TaxID=191477 RepID=UPI002FE49F37